MIEKKRSGPQNAWISIRSTHTGPDTEPFEMEYSCPAVWKQLAGTHCISYEEILDLSGEVSPDPSASKAGPTETTATRVLIKAAEDSAQLIRKGEFDSRLVFDPKEKKASRYGTPFGELDAAAAVSCYQLEEQPGRLHLKLRYTLELNGQYISDCDMEIDVRDHTGSLS